MASESGSPCPCGFWADAPEHHDELLSVETASFDAVTSIIEMAVTWNEVEYDERPLIDPSEWLDFADAHTWSDPARVTDFFLATISLLPPRPRRSIASVVPLRAERCEEPPQRAAPAVRPAEAPSTPPWRPAWTGSASGDRDRCGSAPYPQQ